MTGRPEALFPLFAKLETLEGVGPKTAQNFAQLGVMAPRDLLFTLPYSGIDRRLQPSVKDAILPATVTVAVTVGAHRAPANKGGAYRIHVEDSATAFQLVFFHARGDYWKRQMPEGSRRVVSGRVELFDGIPQMVHPDFVVPEAEAGDIPTFEPVYPLTSGITQKLMYKATRAALSRVPEVGEWIDPNQKNQEDWPDFPDALQQAHAPNDMADLSAAAPARARLAYDELLAHQLTLALARAKDRRKAGRKTVGDGHLQQRVLGAQIGKAPGVRAHHREIMALRERRAVGEHKLEMAARVSRRDPGLLCKRVRGCGDRHHFDRADHLALEVAKLGQVGSGNGEAGAPFDERGGDRTQRLDVKAQRHARVALLEGAQEGSEDLSRHHDVDRKGEFGLQPLAQAAHAGEQGLAVLADDLHVGQQGPAVLRQHGFARAFAFEQHQIELGLDLRHGIADDRDRPSQLARGAPEAALLDDGEDDAQVVETGRHQVGHSRSLNISIHFIAIFRSNENAYLGRDTRKRPSHRSRGPSVRKNGPQEPFKGRTALSRGRRRMGRRPLRPRS